jgi:hypothetical protein
LEAGASFVIENEKQYHITRAQAAQFEAGIKKLELSLPGSALHPMLAHAELVGMRSQLRDLRREIAEYEERVGAE